MKIHILIAPEPPKFGTNLIAACGAEVPSAQPVLCQEHGEELHSHWPLIFCRRCFQGHRGYISWIVSGEEGKQLEAGEIE